jgi:hypothetical protein
MNLVAEEKEPKPKNKWHSFLIAIAVVLCLFIAVDICLIIFFVGRDKSAEPREMVLRDPSDDIVLVGTTKQDLEQAMDLAKKWVGSAFKRDAEAGREKIEDIAQLIMSGRLVEVSSGTSCLLLESHPTMCKVQITQGLKKGQTYWVYKEFVGYPEEEEYTPGGVVASICVRYLITGFICCVGIYYLRIKSILLQIVCFILGYLVLTLIWVRIVSHFMF